MAFLDEKGVAQLWDAVKDRLAGAFDSVEFNVAKQAANLVSGDSIATAFGKLAKNYSSILTSISDLNTSLGNRITEVNASLTSQINTKLNKSDVLANYTTTATGKALDASLGPAIKTKMDLADTLNTTVNNMNVSQYRKYVAYTMSAPSGAWTSIGNTVIPANDTHVWLVLGYATDSTTVEHNAAITLECNPADGSTMGMSRVVTQNGGALNCWGFLNAGVNADRTIYLKYRNYTSGALNVYGRIYAFAICDMR